MSSALEGYVNVMEDILSGICPSCRGRHFLRTVHGNELYCVKCKAVYLMVGMFDAVERPKGDGERDQRPYRDVVELAVERHRRGNRGDVFPL